jgi:ribonuclease G
LNYTKKKKAFVAKIRKPVAGLNAAFVNVGFERCLLHYHDLGPIFQLKFIKLVSAGKIKISPKTFSLKRMKKDGTITGNKCQSIYFSTSCERTNTKRTKNSAELSLAGRFIVLVPFSDRFYFSKK